MTRYPMRFWILYLLAQNSDVQLKFREEIIQAIAGGDLAYDELMALPYLNAGVREALRMSVAPSNQSKQSVIMHS